MQAAHDDADVNTAVHHYMAAPSAQMTALLFECLISEYHPGPGAVQLMIERKPVPGQAEEDARLMANAALQVANGGSGLEPRHCRGAVLEQIAERLCRQRPVKVLVEQFVSPLAGYWNNRSRPIDVIVDEPQLEIMECKMAWAEFKGEDVRLFEKIAALASSEGRGCMPVVVSPTKTRR